MAERSNAVYIISVAAELAGVHPQTLRIYERKGLIELAVVAGQLQRAIFVFCPIETGDAWVFFEQGSDFTFNDLRFFELAGFDFRNINNIIDNT